MTDAGLPTPRLAQMVLWIPRRVRREFRMRGGDVRFLMWISFVLSFAWARTWVLYVGKYAPTLTFYRAFAIGDHVVIAGYHPHHIATGVLLMAVAGWISIMSSGRRVRRVMAVCYGVGLGLVVDEVGFMIEGIRPYKNDLDEVFVLVALINLFMISAIYFPHVWSGLERRVTRLWRRRSEAAVPLAVAAAASMPVTPVVESSPAALDEPTQKT